MPIDIACHVHVPFELRADLLPIVALLAARCGATPSHASQFRSILMALRTCVLIFAAAVGTSRPSFLQVAPQMGARSRGACDVAFTAYRQVTIQRSGRPHPSADDLGMLFFQSRPIDILI